MHGVSSSVNDTDAADTDVAEIATDAADVAATSAIVAFLVRNCQHYLLSHGVIQQKQS